MALFRHLSRSQIPITFGELSKFFLSYIKKKSITLKATCIHLVWDTYPEVSIKSGEQSRRRAASGTAVFHLSGESQKVPRSFQQYLSNGKNKEALISFFLKCWQKDINTLQDVPLFFAHGKTCHKFENLNGATSKHAVSSLFCDHQEADSRMMMHTVYAARSSSSIIILSPDTDVFILALSCVYKINSASNLFVLSSQCTLYNMTLLKNTFSEEQCKALLGFRCFTGCDSVSSFRNKGKKTALQVLSKNPVFFRSFAELGESWDPSDGLCQELESYVCRLYGGTETSVDQARLNLFKKKKANELALPPTMDSLYLHIRRAAYQAGIWRRCCYLDIEPPAPELHGWVLTDKNRLDLKWSTLPDVPSIVTDFVQCACKTGCSGVRCSCRRKGMSCTELCECSQCENLPCHDDCHIYSSDEEQECSDSDTDLE